jgi:hypothetical protein
MKPIEERHVTQAEELLGRSRGLIDDMGLSVDEFVGKL